MNWKKNITNIAQGNFRTMNGNADELIGIGRIIKAGFNCSKVDVANARYDAVVDIGGFQKLLRIQIKGTSTGKLSLIGGTRAGKQIKKSAASRKYKYSKNDCDLILGVDSNNGDCFIIPVEDIKNWKDTVDFKHLAKYKENWDIFKKLAKD